MNQLKSQLAPSWVSHSVLKPIKKEMPRTGFEPVSSDRKSEMIGRTTPPGHNVDPWGFEPQTSGFPRLYRKWSYKTGALTRLSYGSNV